MDPQPNLKDILFHDDQVARFLQDTPLSACDEDRRVLAAILPCDPHAFCKPIPGKDFGYVLAVGMIGFSTFFRLPSAVVYRELRVTATDPAAAFEITTADGVVRTNMQELSRTLDRARTEAERMTAFAALTGAFEAPKPRPKPRAFTSQHLGRVRPDTYGDTWTADAMAVPYLDGSELPVSLQNVGPSDAKRIDAALANFLALGSADRIAAAPEVLANCREFLDAVGPHDEADKAMLAITDPAAIWAHVAADEVEVVRDTRAGEPSIYVVLLCRCDWEREHGLQLVYRNGLTLTRVSAQDGSV